VGVKQLLLMLARGLTPAAPKPAKTFTNTLGVKFVLVSKTEEGEGRRNGTPLYWSPQLGQGMTPDDHFSAFGP